MRRIAADPPGDGPVLLLRLLALQEGPSLGDDRPCHTMACAGRLECWQCCHWSGAAEVLGGKAQAVRTDLLDGDARVALHDDELAAVGGALGQAGKPFEIAGFPDA